MKSIGYIFVKMNDFTLHSDHSKDSKKSSFKRGSSI